MVYSQDEMHFNLDITHLPHPLFPSCPFKKLSYLKETEDGEIAVLFAGTEQDVLKRILNYRMKGKDKLLLTNRAGAVTSFAHVPEMLMIRMLTMPCNSNCNYPFSSNVANQI